jgi:hypothetical protein
MEIAHNLRTGVVTLELDEVVGWSAETGPTGTRNIMAVILEESEFAKLARLMRTSTADTATLKKERDDALSARDAWKELAERADERLAPTTTELRRVRRELRDARAKTHHLEADLALATRTVRDLRSARVPADGSGGRFSITLPATDSPKAYVTISGGDGTAPQMWAGVSQDEADELKATVVRQANEITALKGESA